MIRLTDFTIDELAQQYNAMQWRIEIKRLNPTAAWSLIHCKNEQADIYKTMLAKIPDSHLEEITALVKHANTPSVQPSERYSHKHLPHYTITVLYTTSNHYKCALYKHNNFSGTCNLTARQIHRHFTRLS